MMFSQNDTITGSYYQSSGNPEGGTNFIILPNNTFVVAYFGGMRKGTWELKENDSYAFTFHVEPQFVLYGRYNPKFKDSVAVRMSTDSDNYAVVRFNDEKQTRFTPVFNKDANCFSYPYIYSQKEALKTLEAFTIRYSDYGKAEFEGLTDYFSFKIDEDYNEFMLTGLPKSYSEGGSFMATFTDGILAIEGEKPIKKRKAYNEIDEETLGFVKQHTENEMLPKVLSFESEFFPYYDHPTETDLKSFLRIEPQLKSSKGITISEHSLFVVTCED